MSSSPTIRKVAEADFPTRWGHFRILGFEGGNDASGKPETAVALVLGDYANPLPLGRVHSQCLTGDVFGSLRCDCRQQLEMALPITADPRRALQLHLQHAPPAP